MLTDAPTVQRLDSPFLCNVTVTESVRRGRDRHSVPLALLLRYKYFVEYMAAFCRYSHVWRAPFSDPNQYQVVKKRGVVGDRLVCGSARDA